MSTSKPIMVHIRALAACSVFPVFACVWSWFLPFSTMHFTRASPNRVDCHVEQRLLGLIPFERIDLRDVRSVSLGYVHAHRATTGGLHYLNLGDAGENQTSISSTGFASDNVKRIEEFLTDASQVELQSWTMPVLGYATPLIALPGLLLAVAVLWDMVVSQVAWFIGPEQLVVQDELTGGDDNDAAG